MTLPTRSGFTPDQQARIDARTRELEFQLRPMEVTMLWRWTIKRWWSGKSRWGVEFVRRPRLKHSQVRLQVGHRRFTLMAVAHGSADVESR